MSRGEVPKWVTVIWNFIEEIKKEIQKQRISVVIELKTCNFEPGFISQLNMYQNVVNDILRHPDDKPTIGLLLVKERIGIIRINCRKVQRALHKWRDDIHRGKIKTYIYTVVFTTMQIDEMAIL